MGNPRTFEQLGVDARIGRYLNERGISAPTAVQAEGIPHVMAGKDVVAVAATGSGKTFAYLVPLVQQLLSGPAEGGAWRAVVLVPTTELCEQVRLEAAAMLLSCNSAARVTVIAAGAQRREVAQAGALVVTTPTRLAGLLSDGLVGKKTLQDSLKMLVLDEADLLLSYGYAKDVEALAPVLPRGCQCTLVSATTSEAMQKLSGLVLHNPVTLDVSHAPSAPLGTAAAEVEHCVATVAAQDRLLAVLVMLRLNLVKRKVLLFVNSVATAYRLRLLLEAFGCRAAVLNAEMPLNSRHHVIDTFNRDLVPHLIAPDLPSHADARPGSGAASAARGAKRKRGRRAAKEEEGGGAGDGEFGVTRGVDFKAVRTVVNVDVPRGLKEYVHRVGRTGRAGAAGMAVTLATADEQEFVCSLRKHLEDRAGQGGCAAGAASGSADEPLQPFRRLTADAIEALRYRAADVQRCLTKEAVRRARARDLRAEILNSSKLETYFEAHAADARLLKHDKQLALEPQKQKHLRHLPDYLKQAVASAGAHGHAQRAAGRKRKLARELDPLKASTMFVQDEAPTQLEETALKKAKKANREMMKKATPAPVPKRNVRKRR